jgi:hypothetical protein
MGMEVLLAGMALALAGLAFAKVRATGSASQENSEGASLRTRIERLEQLSCALVSEDEARHLWFLSRSTPVSYDSHAALQQELRSLVRRGLIGKRGDFKIHELGETFDLGEQFELTDLGRQLLVLRRHLERTDTRVADSVLPSTPRVSEAARRASA